MNKFEEQYEMNIGARELMEYASAEWEELHRLLLEEAWIEEPSKKDRE
jgi:hypothetical protein